jgi:DNA-binding NarL/FixJ family response regulator
VAISIVLADENAIIRRGLLALFGSEPDFMVVGVASCGPETLRLAERLQPDVLVVDLMMAGLGGLASLSLLRRRAPQTRIVVLSMRHSSAFVSHALNNGAAAYALKSGSEESLVNAVKDAGKDRHFLDSPAPFANRSYTKKSKPNLEPGHTLTRRQNQVLQLTARGKTSAQSAAALHISPRTVENHRAMLMERLGLSNRTELIRHAIRVGLISLDDGSV